MHFQIMRINKINVALAQNKERKLTSRTICWSLKWIKINYAARNTSTSIHIEATLREPKY